MKIIMIAVFVLSNVVNAQNLNEESTEKDILLKAKELSNKILIVDTHIDLPYRLKNRWEDVSVRTDYGHFDLFRANKGGLNAAFMSIFIPARFEEKGGSAELADTLIDIMEFFADKYPKKFSIAHTPKDIVKNFKAGIFSFPLGIENGTPIEGSFENLQHFYDRGVRYITLSHGKANHICDSSYDPERKWNGLSPFGKTLIPEMNRLGIMVDISHVSDSTFYQVLEITNAPVIASHSSCRKFTPGFERNMSDDMIRKLATNGGVIQITFGSYFVSGKYQAKMKEFEGIIKEHNVGRWSKEGKKFYKNFVKENDLDYGTTKLLVDHIDHVVNLVGIDHVGLGSDFDGINALPSGIADVSSYPNIIYELLLRGYSEDDIIKICSGNILRVWSEVDKIANSN